MLLAVDLTYVSEPITLSIDDPSTDRDEGNPYVEIMGSYDGATNKTEDIIDFTADVDVYAPEIHGDDIPAIEAKDGTILYPIDSTFGFVGTDFVGAVDKELDGVHREGWVGNLYDDQEEPVGLLVSNVETDTFRSTLPLGTWAAGLGGNSVKASTEHFVVMTHLLADDSRPITNPFDPNGDGSSDDAYSNLELIGGDYGGWNAAAAIADAGDTNGDGLYDLRDVMAPNESSVVEDIAVSYNSEGYPEYSVTLKDDGKLLFRWGTMIKRPNDIRVGVHVPLPEEWGEASTDPEHPGFVVSQAELRVRHTISNNPNDQIRPEDLENELATGRKPSYQIIAHPDPLAPEGAFLWVSDRDDYAGDSTPLPSYFLLDDQGEIVTDAGPQDVVAYDLDGNVVGVVATDDDDNPIGTVFRDSTVADTTALSADLRYGFTWQWYTTMDRDPFESYYDSDGELISGPRWRLLSNKFGQDIPGMEIPLQAGSEPPFQSDNIKYEVGTETITTIDLLDGAGQLDNGIDLRMSDHWTSLLTDEEGAIVDERYSHTDYTNGLERDISINGLELTDGFDFSLYIKGDRKPIELRDVQLVVTYRVDDAFDHGDAPATYEASDPAAALMAYSEFALVDESGELVLDDHYNLVTQSVPNFYLGEPVQVVPVDYTIPEIDDPELTEAERAAILLGIQEQLALVESLAISSVFGEVDIDAEYDAPSSADALGDDQLLLADEQGVSFKTVVAPGQETRILVSANLGLEAFSEYPDADPEFVVTPTPGYLFGWMDYDGNGLFDESERLVFDTLIDEVTGEEIPVYGGELTHGEITELSFLVPAVVEAGNTFARFRLSPVNDETQVLPTGMIEATDPTGAVLNQGEIEDHAVLITSIFDDVVGRDLKDGDWWVGLSDGNRFQESPYNAEWDVKSDWQDVMVVDVNGDGVDDVVGRTFVKSKKETDRWSWSAAVSKYIPAGVDEDGNPTGDRWTFANKSNWASWPADVAWTDVLAVDFNGDGRDEIIGRNEDGNWTLSSYDNSFHDSMNVKWDGEYADVMTGDYNGDGRGDVAGRTVDGKWEVISYTYRDGESFSGVQFTSEVWDGAPWDTSQSYENARTADVNGDGRDDLVATIVSTGQWIVAESRVSSTGNDGFNSDKWGGTNPNLDYLNVMVGDVNADGLEDIITRTDGDRFLVEVSTGDDFETQNFGAWDSKTKWVDVVSGDFNGDGLADVAGRNDKTGQWTAGLSEGDGFDFRNFGNWDAKTKWDDVMSGDFDDPAWSIFEDPDMTGDLVLQLDSEDAVTNESITVVGDWTVSTEPTGFVGENYLLGLDTDATTVDTVTFAPDLPSDGLYALYINWVADEGRSTDVPVEIAYGYGATTVVSLDQTVTPDVWENPTEPDDDGWYPLGEYNLVAGIDGAVTISSDSETETVSVDAIRYVYLGSLDTPIQVTDATLDPERADIIIDGDWQVSTAVEGSEGDSYLVEVPENRDTVGESVTFAPGLTLGGYYHVYLSWNTFADAEDNETYREASVPVTIANSTDVIAELTVDQQQDPDGDEIPGGWAKLGTFDLQAGTGGAFVTVSDEDSSGVEATVVADAVRFVWVGFDFGDAATDDSDPGDTDPDGTDDGTHGENSGGSQEDGDAAPGEGLQRLTPGSYDLDGDEFDEFFVSKLHVFTIDDVVGDFDGVTYADDSSIIDTSGLGDIEPIVSKDGVTLYPIDSVFGFNVVDFVGADQKERDDIYGEGWVGNITGDLDAPLGMELSDAKTDLFKSGLPLGTWLTGLGGVTVKASTEHYNVMAEILGLDASPNDDVFRQIDLTYNDADGSFTPTDDHLNEYTAGQLMTAWDNGAILPNESSVIQDIFFAVDGDDLQTPIYSVTFKDDGKLLYRWGTAVKRPNDIRMNASLELPKAWTEGDNPLTYEVTTANLRVNHAITNNPNDQIRPEDLENELAKGRKPSYIQIVHPDDPSNSNAFQWVSFVDDYAGDGAYLPSYFLLDDEGNIVDPEGATEDVIEAWVDGERMPIGIRNRDLDGNIAGTVLRDSLVVDEVALSADREFGYTSAWYTTMDRDPFEPNLQYNSEEDVFEEIDLDPTVEGDEFLLLVQPGPRWRLQAGKFGQDLPGVDIPEIAHSRPPFTKDNIKYEVGKDTTTVINLLDGAGLLDNGIDLRISDHWTSLLTNDVTGEIIDERYSHTDEQGRDISINGLELTDGFDFSVYIKGDRKPTNLYDAQLVLEYQIVSPIEVQPDGTLAASIGDVPNVTYTWSVDDQVVDGPQDSTFDLAEYASSEGLSAESYTVSLQVIDAFGTMGSDTIEMDVAYEFPQDVNRDGAVSSIDALLIINEIARDDGEGLPDAEDEYSYDVSGDERISVLDALQVINYLRLASTSVSSIDPIVTEATASVSTLTPEVAADNVFAELGEESVISQADTDASDQVATVFDMMADDSDDDDEEDFLALLAYDVNGLWI